MALPKKYIIAAIAVSVSAAFVYGVRNGKLSSSIADAEIPTYSVIVKHHRFEPTELNVAANQQFKLSVTNLDPTFEELESEDLNIEKMLPIGATVPVLVQPLAPGKYEFEGELHPQSARLDVIAK